MLSCPLVPEVALLTILRAIVLAMSCVLALSGPAPADQWDDLAQKFVDQEHARLVRRAADKDDIVIVDKGGGVPVVHGRQRSRSHCETRDRPQR